MFNVQAVLAGFTSQLKGPPVCKKGNEITVTFRDFEGERILE
jgi:hypothetical protein